MDWSVALPNIWFLLITILFTGFFVLEGYDFGVGVLAQVLGKTDEEKRSNCKGGSIVWIGQ